jgi:protease-4
LREYPEKKTFIEQLMGGYKKSVSSQLMKEQIDPAVLQVLGELKQVKQMVGVPQARIPFMVNIQ